MQTNSTEKKSGLSMMTVLVSVVAAVLTTLITFWLLHSQFNSAKGIDGWPVAIKCDRTEPKASNNIYVLGHTSYKDGAYYYRPDSAHGGTKFRVKFSLKTRKIVSTSGNKGKLSNCKKGASIDTFIEQGRAF